MQGTIYSNEFEFRFTVGQCYEVVLQVDKYSQFVPFCTACSIIQDVEMTSEEQDWMQHYPDGQVVFALTSIGFKSFSEAYRSRIKCIPNSRIEVSSI